MLDVGVDMIIYIIIAFVVVVLDVLSIMDGKNFSYLKSNKNQVFNYINYITIFKS